jgi:hypothetical protein
MFTNKRVSDRIARWGMEKTECTGAKERKTDTQPQTQCHFRWCTSVETVLVIAVSCPQLTKQKFRKTLKVFSSLKKL